MKQPRGLVNLLGSGDPTNGYLPTPKYTITEYTKSGMHLMGMISVKIFAQK